MNFTSNRKFRLWHYSVSHSMLFLRSNKAVSDSGDVEQSETTVDIEFYDVVYIGLPITLNGIELTDVTQKTPTHLDQFLKQDSMVFRLSSEKRSYYVIAAGCKVGQSQFDYDEHRISNLFLKYDQILF